MNMKTLSAMMTCVVRRTREQEALVAKPLFLAIVSDCVFKDAFLPRVKRLGHHRRP